MNKHLFVLALAYSLFVCSCLSPSDKQLEQALDFAGDNRAELEKVLEHYANETEKREAARFLIRNMPRWYGYTGAEWDSIKPILVNIIEGKTVADNILNKWESTSLYNLPKIYDAHVITSDYLIENIDLAFEVWKKYPWNRSLGFDDFCELILPYRIGDEPLSSWRKLYHDHYTALLDSAYRGSDVTEACNIICKDLNRVNHYWNTNIKMPHQPADFLFYHRIGYCRDADDITLYAMQACGIPVASECFVYSPEYQHLHEWTVLRDTTGQFIQFGFNEFDATRHEKKSDGRKKGKVYRFCFGIQDEPFSGITADKTVPALFRNRFLKDVTDHYFGRNEVEISVQPSRDKYVYLGVFSPQGWIPVAMARNDKNKVIFKNLEPDIIYQPLYFDGYHQRAAGYPFLFTKDSIHTLAPDKGQMQEVILKRKMSLTKRIAEFSYRAIIGARIEGCKEPSFVKPDLLYRFGDTLKTNYYELSPSDTNKMYRYIRYCSPAGKHIELGELAIYERAVGGEKIEIKRINDIKPLHSLKNITDGDILTYFESEDTTCFITYDLGKATKIEKIVFSPRNDDNFVWPGHDYELFYQDGTNGWKSLGRQTALKQELIYKVPKNALLWLCDQTKGREEQVFIYKDGEQFFVFDL